MSITYTENQQVVFERANALGELHYDGDHRGLTFKPRLFPLIVGPTGAGKSFLVKQIAEKLQAYYMRLTFGSWLPIGVDSDRGGATSFRIMDALWNNHRVAVHIDELDKCKESFAQAWERSIYNDIWNVLDRALLVEEWVTSRLESSFLQPADEDNKSIYADNCITIMKDRVQKGLWIVGSGTWQSLFDTSNRGLGFGVCDEAEDALVQRVYSSGMISSELLARFNSELLILRYPESLKETKALLQGSGLTDLAKTLNVELKPEEIDFSKTGMRIMETLACELLLKDKATRAEKKDAPVAISGC